MRRIRPWACAIAATAAGASACAAVPLADEPTLGTMFRMFTDSDRVGVRSMTSDVDVPLPGASLLTVHFNNERVTIPAIAAPAGTQDAVDAITTASRPISGNAFEDFIKVRNEVTTTLSRGPASVEYYVSSESDYLAQQLGGRWNRDFRDQTFTLSVASSYGWDRIEPLADDDTDTGARSKTTWHGNVIGTGVLSPSTLVRVGAEVNLVHGLQHNAYRNVYAGGTNVSERHPEDRQRRDAFIRLHQYFSQRSSLKLSYRLYDDDWGIASHEIESRLSQYLKQGLSSRYIYRWYTQTAADFYRDEYASTDGIDGYRSGDYRMDELSSHLFGVALHADLDALAVPSPWMRRFALWLSYERYFNRNNYSANILETGLDFRFQ